jgi:hypothetical protein
LVALIAISPCGEGEPDGAGKHLADAAHRSGMRFFSTRYSLGARQQRDVFRTVGKYDSNNDSFGAVQFCDDGTGGLRTE